MDFDFTQILEQIPTVALFVYFVLTRDKARSEDQQVWREYLKDRNGKTDKALGLLADAVKSMQETQAVHTNVLIRMVNKKDSESINDLIKKQ